MNITDIQNYMFSFFGGVYFPSADLDELKERAIKLKAIIETQK